MRDGDEISGRRNRRLVAAKERSNAFGAKRRRAFLEQLAASCNVRKAAAAAGVCPKTVYARRKSDAAFRSAWREALEAGYARLELILLERAGAAEPVEFDPGADAGAQAAAEPDTALARFLWQEHRKGLDGQTHRGGPPLRSAEWREVEDWFVARLRALNKRILGQGGGGAGEGSGGREAPAA